MPKIKNEKLQMFSFFEMTPDLVCIAGKDGFFKKVNPAVIKKLGYSEKELLAIPVSSFIHPDDKELTHAERAKLLTGEALLNFQNRYVSKNGEIIWLEWTSIYIADKEVVFAIAKDITTKKELEKELEEKYKKFKSLATHFKNSIEKDKKYLAIELHEELAQLASVVKIDIDWLNDNIPELPILSKSRITHALLASNLLINTIRRISFSISPTMLDDLGLNEVLKWLCKEFSILSGIPCLYKSAFHEESLTPEVQLDFFRICQESLSNVMYHAQAKNVKISLNEFDNMIQLTITDDGKGFKLTDKKNTPGLTSMRERAASINGHLKIESEIGIGTSVYIVLKKSDNKQTQHT